MSISLLIGLGLITVGGCIVLLSLTGVEFSKLISFGLFEP